MDEANSDGTRGPQLNDRTTRQKRERLDEMKEEVSRW